jgi:hypothetical protein
VCVCVCVCACMSCIISFIYTAWLACPPPILPACLPAGAPPSFDAASYEIGVVVMGAYLAYLVGAADTEGWCVCVCVCVCVCLGDGLNS